MEVPDDTKLLSVFTDVSDCFFRFLAANLASEGVLEEDDFRRTVAEVTREYQASVPELADPSGALQLVGTLKNPVAGF